jgi:hypothetical protein
MTYHGLAAVVKRNIHRKDYELAQGIVEKNLDILSYLRKNHRGYALQGKHEGELLEFLESKGVRLKQRKNQGKFRLSARALRKLASSRDSQQDTSSSEDPSEITEKPRVETPKPIDAVPVGPEAIKYYITSLRKELGSITNKSTHDYSIPLSELRERYHIPNHIIMENSGESRRLGVLGHYGRDIFGFSAKKVLSLLEWMVEPSSTQNSTTSSQ